MLAIFVPLLFFLGGCGAAGLESGEHDNAGFVSETPILSAPESGRSLRDASAAPPSRFVNSDLDKLQNLWHVRSQRLSASDYPVGAGDVLEISVPAIEELRDRIVRISGEGAISLPFIGSVQAAGLTEDALKQQLVERLKKYMFNPRVVLFVKEYRSRQVAVLGEVVKPGLYSLVSGADTILDVISQAGGLKPGADPKIYLIPAEQVSAGQAQQVAAVLPASLLSRDPAPLILKRTDPILIDTTELAIGGYQHYLSMSVRPGDLIMVPGGGQVLVEGWVEKPGAYAVSPGLTVAGVVAAAGGPLYPADVAAVKVIRSGKGGKKTFIVADLPKIKRGEAEDVALQGGDIVDVAAENSRLIPYGLYRFFTTVVNVGIGGTIPLFTGS